MNSNLGKRVFKHGLVLTTTILACTALQAKDNDQLANGAEKFVHKALAGGKMEVEMGQLAQQKGQSQDVKNLGETLVRDHTQANQRLQQLASTKNITVTDADLTKSAPSSINSTTTATDTGSSAAHRQSSSTDRPGKGHGEMSKLQSQSGQEFDKTFVRMAIKDHKKDITEFEHARTEINDPEIKSFIDETLPKLRQHLEQAQSAARTVGVDPASIAADKEDDSTSAVGGAASGTTGTRGSDKPSSPASDGNRSSLDNDRLNGATDTTASGTVVHNSNPRADLEANVGDHSVSAHTDVDNTAATSGDTTHKGKVFEKGDGKVLGLSTDKNDGKFLGIIPDPKKKDHDNNGANVNADVNVNGHEASVGGSATTESGSSQSK